MKIERNVLFKIIGYLGLALIFTAYLIYSIRETTDTLIKSLYIIGALFLAAGIIFNIADIRTYFSKRSTRLGTNTLVLSIAFIAILGFLNYLGYRHHKRFDLTSEKLYSLSDQTRKIVSGLQKDVRVIHFSKDDNQVLKDLVTEYRNISPRINYERIDPQVKPEVAKQYNITGWGETVVVADKRTERPQETNEQAITNAIIKVTREKLKTICFTEGHSEKSITANEAESFGMVNTVLKNENYETKAVNLASSNQVPSECEVVVMAGPKQAPFKQEVELLGKYLEGGGKVMFLVDPDTDPNLKDLLTGWNIELGTDVVLDVSAVNQMTGTGPVVPLVINYGSHPITKDFERSMSIFPYSRSVKILDQSKTDVTTTELLKTSEESWAETDELKENGTKFDEGKDKKGPITLGIAASKKTGEKESRLVVIGDSDFASNNYFRIQRNGDIFINAINWLSQDEDLISIRPKDPTNRSVTMTASQKKLLFWLLILLFPGAVLCTGIYIWWNRR
jgi:ABC-type uncharacterized transport system involved in gliding motility auxiliary subunit